MALYTIADLHLSTFTDKPMDIFEGWHDYTARLIKNWEMLIKDDDVVVIPGDLSWAKNMEEALSDFTLLHELKGKKILLKGNHDYWYATATKTRNWLNQNGLNSISVLNNNSFMVGDIGIAGTRGWNLDRSSREDMKIYNREVQRLQLSLEDAKKNEPSEIIVFLHYPPVYPTYDHEEIIELLVSYNVRRCYYGHVHGKNSIKSAMIGEKHNIYFKLISADYLRFLPLLVEK